MTQIDRDIIENMRNKHKIDKAIEILQSDKKEIYSNKFGWIKPFGMRIDFTGSKIYMVHIKGKLYEYHDYALPPFPPK